MSNFKIDTHQRGMRIFKFDCDYRWKGEIQESSAVDPHLWVSITEDNKGNKIVGQVIEGHDTAPSLHISRDTAWVLGKLLLHFAKQGELPDAIPQETTDWIYNGGDRTKYRRNERGRFRLHIWQTNKPDLGYLKWSVAVLIPDLGWYKLAGTSGDFGVSGDRAESEGVRALEHWSKNYVEE